MNSRGRPPLFFCMRKSIIESTIRMQEAVFCWILFFFPLLVRFSSVRFIWEAFVCFSVGWQHLHMGRASLTTRTFFFFSPSGVRTACIAMALGRLFILPRVAWLGLRLDGWMGGLGGLKGKGHSGMGWKYLYE